MRKKRRNWLILFDYPKQPDNERSFSVNILYSFHLSPKSPYSILINNIKDIKVWHHFCDYTM